MSSAAFSPPTDHPSLPALHPRTPSFDGTVNSTPIFSSPDTPRDQPSRLVPSLLGKRLLMDPEPDPEEHAPSGSFRMEHENEKRREEELGIGSSKRVDDSPLQIPKEMLHDGPVVGLYPDTRDMDQVGETEDDEQDVLESMKKRLEGIDREFEDASAQKDELRKILEHMMETTTAQITFLQQQVEAQRETIRTLQQQAKISKSLTGVERDRMQAERDAYRAELRALEIVRRKEVAAISRPNRMMDLDVGYHQELEAANKRLEMDNRLMAPRLEDTQRQIDKLVTELRHLRSQVILSTEPLAPRTPGQDSIGQDVVKTISPVRPSTISRATMGDARTEHLLLAARKVRSMRSKDDRVGRLTLDELRRGGVIGPDGGVGYMEGYGENMGEEDEYEEEESDLEEIKPNVDVVKRGKAGATPLLPRAKKSSKRSLPPPTTPRSKQSVARPQTTPGGSNFNDLLRAAEMATRPTTPTSTSAKDLAAPSSAFSAARSTNRAGITELSDRGSPVKRQRREPPPAWGSIPMETPDQPGSEAGLDALDLLAQASQLDVAQSGDASDMELPSSQRSAGALAPAIDLRSSGVAPTADDDVGGAEYSRDSSVLAATPKFRPRTLSNASEIHTPARGNGESYEETPYSGFTPPSSVIRDREVLAQDPPPGAYASPTGAAVPGLGKYVHLTSSMPARRIRSPYLKWTVEEDELLARAVAMHGEKWDLVSKGVPTRSYHQVRQRWLRKTGAFDKKPQTQNQTQTITIAKEEADEDEDGSPTPTPRQGGGEGPKVLVKKRKASASRPE